ncbi:MAG: hypothetical protein J1F63_00465 [Oscillospiraceae bacterium]|nr:hypothetical protein [Oscillospiraceae bacterium]
MYGTVNIGGGGGSVSVDDTLTREGEAADAKAVGDKFREMEELRLRNCYLEFPRENIFTRDNKDTHVYFRIRFSDIAEYLPDDLKTAQQIISVRRVAFHDGLTFLSTTPFTWAADGNFALQICLFITEGESAYDVMEREGIEMGLDIIYTAYPTDMPYLS